MTGAPATPGPEALRHALQAAVDRGLARGALTPVESTCHVVVDGGIPFVVRVLAGLAAKRALGAARARTPGPAPDPFLPWDPDLFVADLGPRHVGLLNKFPVLERHLLVVTRAWAHQDEALTPADLEALWRPLAALEGLAFYNGGRTAGASQPHKHLQVVPLPLGPGGAGLPIDAALRQAADGLDAIAAFPFRHAFARLDLAPSTPPAAAARRLHAACLALLDALGLHAPPHGSPERPAPYNLLVTPAWMIAVPRRVERFHGISVNALGFAGSLVVRDDAERARIAAAGPLAVLRAVAGPP